MIASAAFDPSSRNGYGEFLNGFARVAAAFLLAAPLVAYLCDVALLTGATVLDGWGYSNSVADAERGITFSQFVTSAPLALLVLVAPSLIPALFAMLSFVVVGRVSFWWMVATAPLAVYRGGFSFFAELNWTEINIPAISSRFFFLLTIELVVVAVCWWLVRNVRRPTLWQILR